MRLKRIVAVLSIVFILFGAGFGFKELNVSADVFDDYKNYHILDIRAWLLHNGYNTNDLCAVSMPFASLDNDTSLSISDLSIKIGSVSYPVLFRLLDITSNSFVSSIPFIPIDSSIGYLDLQNITILAYIPVNLVGENLDNIDFSIYAIKHYAVYSDNVLKYYPCFDSFLVRRQPIDVYVDFSTNYIGRVPIGAYSTINAFQDGYNIGYDDGHFDGYYEGYTDGYTDGFQTDIYNMYVHNKATHSYSASVVDVDKSENGYFVFINGSSSSGTIWIIAGYTLKKDVIYTLSFDFRKFNEVDSSRIRMRIVTYVGSTQTCIYEENFYDSSSAFQRYVMTFAPSVNVDEGRLYFDIWAESGGEICNIQLNEGYNDVYRFNAYDAGFDAGYTVGYNFGKEVGLQGSITTSWFTSFLDGFVRLLNIQIFPNITLGTIAGVSILLGFIAFLFRFKGGG